MTTLKTKEAEELTNFACSLGLSGVVEWVSVHCLGNTVEGFWYRKGNEWRDMIGLEEEQVKKRLQDFTASYLAVDENYMGSAGQITYTFGFAKEVDTDRDEKMKVLYQVMGTIEKAVGRLKGKTRDGVLSSRLIPRLEFEDIMYGK